MDVNGTCEEAAMEITAELGYPDYASLIATLEG